MTTAAVKPWFEWVFRHYGLPETLRTDNGAPFASVAAGGLTQLSKWWVRLGIRPQRIRPAKRVKTVATNACTGRSKRR